MSTRLAGLTIGAIFGVVLSWSGMTSPVIIRQALLFQHAYLFLFFASAVLVATIGLALLRRLRVKALITRERVEWPSQPVQRRHITGSVGWGIADACPGPIATQLGQGVAWGLWTLAGVILGVHLFLRQDEPDTEPAVEGAQRPPHSPSLARERHLAS
jgi:cytochrome c biogenesis protein CcdA